MADHLDPALVFPVPEDGSEELELLAAGPEMPGHIKPVWPGIYIRNIEGEWEWNEFMDDYWAAMGIFPHEVEEAPWRGAILKATERMMTGRLLNVIARSDASPGTCLPTRKSCWYC